MARMRFKGEKPASAEELSDTGRAAPDTAHAAAAGRRAPTVSHTPRRHVEPKSWRWLRKRERETGSDADELQTQIRRWPASPAPPHAPHENSRKHPVGGQEDGLRRRGRRPRRRHGPRRPRRGARDHERRAQPALVRAGQGHGPGQPVQRGPGQGLDHGERQDADGRLLPRAQDVAGRGGGREQEGRRDEAVRQHEAHDAPDVHARRHLGQAGRRRRHHVHGGGRHRLRADDGAAPGRRARALPLHDQGARREGLGRRLQAGLRVRRLLQGALVPDGPLLGPEGPRHDDGLRPGPGARRVADGPRRPGRARERDQQGLRRL
mmetsp:Transcript_18376/g.56910  ORF Transcript_18376/g.56910 Transcript_18376/m.56910 type:complete len:321 (+) Transcript_18376:296-1258(+)